MLDTLLITEIMRIGEALVGFNRDLFLISSSIA